MNGDLRTRVEALTARIKREVQLLGGCHPIDKGARRNIGIDADRLAALVLDADPDTPTACPSTCLNRLAPKCVIHRPDTPTRADALNEAADGLAAAYAVSRIDDTGADIDWLRTQARGESRQP